MPPAAGILAPLQTIMLLDSLLGECPGAHVEQLELIFQPTRSVRDVEAAWATMVAQTEVLRMGFSLDAGEPFLWELALVPGTFESEPNPPDNLEKWRFQDRLRPLLESGSAPWRVRYWPFEGRLVWTFHHALLDGRSIARIVRRFLKCLQEGTIPEPAPVTLWTTPEAQTRELAGHYFRQWISRPEEFSENGVPVDACVGKAVGVMGRDFAERLGCLAQALDVTAGTLLIWTWGQAVMMASGAAVAVVEQVRCGPPQPGNLGFTINTLPIRIDRADHRPLALQLQELRSVLIELRKFEAFPPQNLPDELLKMTQARWSSVIMIEHATLADQIGVPSGCVTLHECQGESLTAAAYVKPDLRLEVEGVAQSQLLEHWKLAIERLLECPSCMSREDP